MASTSPTAEAPHLVDVYLNQVLLNACWTYMLHPSPKDWHARELRYTGLFTG